VIVPNEQSEVALISRISSLEDGVTAIERASSTCVFYVNCDAGDIPNVAVPLLPAAARPLFFASHRTSNASHPVAFNGLASPISMPQRRTTNLVIFGTTGHIAPRCFLGCGRDCLSGLVRCQSSEFLPWRRRSLCGTRKWHPYIHTKGCNVTSPVPHLLSSPVSGFLAGFDYSSSSV
jgi:hypothetical protein